MGTEVQLDDPMRKRFDEVVASLPFPQFIADYIRIARDAFHVLSEYEQVSSASSGVAPITRERIEGLLSFLPAPDEQSRPDQTSVDGDSFWDEAEVAREAARRETCLTIARDLSAAYNPSSSPRTQLVKDLERAGKIGLDLSEDIELVLGVPLPMLVDSQTLTKEQRMADKARAQVGQWIEKLEAELVAHADEALAAVTLVTIGRQWREAQENMDEKSECTKRRRLETDVQGLEFVVESPNVRGQLAQEMLKLKRHLLEQYSPDGPFAVSRAVRSSIDLYVDQLSEGVALQHREMTRSMREDLAKRRRREMIQQEAMKVFWGLLICGLTFGAVVDVVKSTTAWAVGVALSIVGYFVTERVVNTRMNNTLGARRARLFYDLALANYKANVLLAISNSLMQPFLASLVPDTGAA